MGSIKYNKEKAERHRLELESILNAMKVVKDDHLKARKDRIDKVWDGDASEVFKTKMNDLESHMEDTITKIDNLLNALTEISQSIENTETKNTQVSS